LCDCLTDTFCASAWHARVPALRLFLSLRSQRWRVVVVEEGMREGVIEGEMGGER
jgi:hypothetical protein